MEEFNWRKKFEKKSTVLLSTSKGSVQYQRMFVLLILVKTPPTQISINV